MTGEGPLFAVRTEAGRRAAGGRRLTVVGLVVGPVGGRITTKRPDCVLRAEQISATFYSGEENGRTVREK